MKTCVHVHVHVHKRVKQPWRCKTWGSRQENLECTPCSEAGAGVNSTIAACRHGSAVSATIIDHTAPASPSVKQGSFKVL